MLNNQLVCNGLIGITHIKKTGFYNRKMIVLPIHNDNSNTSNRQACKIWRWKTPYISIAFGINVVKGTVPRNPYTIIETAKYAREHTVAAAATGDWFTEHTGTIIFST